MNTPTEAHYQLAHDILQSSYQEESAKLIASSEARACDQLRSDLERADTLYQRACEVEHELRAEVKRMTHAYEYDHKCLYEVRDRCHLWKQRAEKAERAETVALANWNGALERALKAEAERDQLHAQLRALTLICGTNDANKFETWIDRANARAERAEAAETVALAHWNKELKRAMKAEADLVALGQCHDDNCRAVVQIDAELAAERARLDSGQILLIVAGERVWHCGVDLRAAIDAGMQEDAK